MGKKKLKIISFALFQGLMLTLIGFGVGLIYSVGGFFYDLFTIGLNRGTALAFLALIGMPVVFGLFGLALGLIEAILYNFFIRWFPGMDLDLER